jgi:hypothetical protein
MDLMTGLVHWPIRDRNGVIVATNVTNLDVHDIARASRVYGVISYYIIHPLQDQLMFVERMLDHWRAGEGATLNPKRKTALTMVKTAPNLAAVLEALGDGPKPFVVATHARSLDGVPTIRFSELRAKLESEPGRCLLLFGTGFGLTDEFMRSCDAILEPIKGGSVDDYRHLSVRSAASICLDRLRGEW